MPTVHVRINESAHRDLKRLAEEEGSSLQEILDKAVEHYRRRRFIEQANAAYARLRSDPEAWREELEERASYDGALRDGIDD